MKNWETLYEIKGPKGLLEMTAKELEEALEVTDMAIFSFAAIENHSIHLPLGADYFQGNLLIRYVHEALNKLGIPSIVGFCSPFGVESNHFERDTVLGNCTLTQSTFIAMVKDLVLSMYRHGIKRFVLCINHSENDAPLQVAAKDLADLHGIDCIVVDWVPPMNDVWPTFLKNAEHQGHGGEDETSCVMAAVPRLVDLSQADPLYYDSGITTPFANLYYYGGAVGIYRNFKGAVKPDYVGNPQDSTVETGEKCFELYAEWIAKIIKDFFVK